MSTPISVYRFEGIAGLRVVRDAGVAGELDPADTVVDTRGQGLAWSDPAFVAARAAYERTEAALDLSTASFRAATCGLQPPRTPLQNQRCAGLPSGRPSERDITKVMETLRALLAATASPAQRAEANTSLAWGEGILAEHFTTFFWNKVGPGRRALGHLQAAAREDPRSTTAAASYALALVGIRASTFRRLVETAVPIDSTAELVRVAQILALRRDDLQAQAVTAAAIDELRSDGALTPALTEAAAGIQERIATLRAQDPKEAERVDDSLAQLRQRSGSPRR